MRGQRTEDRGQGRRQGIIFVISGPSGSGKTTLLDKLLKDRQLKNKLTRSISFTTRPKRSGELDKRDYFFISGTEFIEKQREKKILEWTEYLGYYYATPKEFVDKKLARGSNIALCLDVKGALRIKRIYPANSVLIFIKPPSISELRKRIANRCAKTMKDEILKRVSLAKAEIAKKSKYDYTLENRDLKEAVKGLKKIVVKEINH